MQNNVKVSDLVVYSTLLLKLETLRKKLTLLFQSMNIFYEMEPLIYVLDHP